MKIKRFTTSNMQAGLKTIGETLGPEAVILSNKRQGDGLEIVAGVDEQEYEQFLATQPKQAARVEPNEPTDIIKAAKADTLDEKTMQQLFSAMADKNQQAFQKAGVTSASDAQESNSQPVKRVESSAESASKQKPIKQTNLSAPIVDMKEFGLLRREIDDLKSLLRDQVEQSKVRVSSEDVSPQYERLEARFDALGFTPKVTRRLMANYDREDSLENNWRQMMARLSSSLRVPIYEPMSDGGVHALIGPTGAGKTTTVAKLAARALKDHGADSVAVISLDWFQVGGQEILRSVCDILGVAFYALNESDSLSDLLAQLTDTRLVLIDTSGSAEALTYWSELTHENPALKSINQIAVLPATMHPSAIHQFMGRHPNINFDAAIISKLDESSCFGGLIEPILRNRWPLWFCTTGHPNRSC